MEHTLTDLVPELANKGVFGPGRHVSLRLDDGVTTGLQAQYSSEVVMLKLKLRVDGGETRSLPIVIKTQFSNEKFRRRKDSASMFRNEVAMYESILPFLDSGGSSPYPKAYFGLATGGEDFEKDVLIAENIRYAGYARCKDYPFLDVNHINVALRRLAELHSWSFIEKTRNKERFFELVGKLEKVVRVRGDEDFDFDKMNYLSIKRGIDALLKTEKDKEQSAVLRSFMKAAENVQKLTEYSQKALEPFGVVVHGDFSASNIMFKYDYKGKPTDCAYFDFQLSKYASPVVDLSFFLYMHTTAETRDEHWEEFLRYYWDCLNGFLPKDVSLPSYEEFEEHLACRAAYGYIVSSFYLPNCLEERVLTNEEFVGLTAKQKVERFVGNGGLRGQESIASIAQHLLSKGYLQEFLKHFQLAQSCQRRSLR